MNHDARSRPCTGRDVIKATDGIVRDILNVVGSVQDTVFVLQVRTHTSKTIVEENTVPRRLRAVSRPKGT